MITSLKIQNFQSHKDTTLEFDKGVNIIIGSSDSGKTAIIRALRWLIWNRPQGESMRSNWGGGTDVEVVFDAPEIEIDPSISRIKDKQDEYIMNGDSFKAFRTDVPEEIVKVLNLNEINLQRQLDSPFLLSETPGVVAQHFNKVAKLDKIDSTTTAINSAIRELTSTIKFKENQQEKSEEELTQFSHLDKFEVELEVLEGVQNTLVGAYRNVSALNSLLVSIKGNAEEIDGYSHILSIEKEVDDLIALYEKASDENANISDLGSDIKALKNIDQQIESLEGSLSFETQVNNLLTLYSQIYEKDKQYDKLYNLMEDISEVTILIKETSDHITSISDEFSKEMGDVCILCGSKLK